LPDVEIHGTDPGQHTIVKFHIDLFSFSSETPGDLVMLAVVLGTYYPDEDRFILDVGMPSERMKPIIKDKILQQIGHKYSNSQSRDWLK